MVNFSNKPTADSGKDFSLMEHMLLELIVALHTKPNLNRNVKASYISVSYTFWKQGFGGQHK